MSRRITVRIDDGTDAILRAMAEAVGGTPSAAIRLAIGAMAGRFPAGGVRGMLRPRGSEEVGRRCEVLATQLSRVQANLRQAFKGVRRDEDQAAIADAVRGISGLDRWVDEVASADFVGDVDPTVAVPVLDGAVRRVRGAGQDLNEAVCVGHVEGWSLHAVDEVMSAVRGVEDSVLQIDHELRSICR